MVAFASLNDVSMLVTLVSNANNRFHVIELLFLRYPGTNLLNKYDIDSNRLKHVFRYRRKDMNSHKLSDTGIYRQKDARN